MRKRLTHARPADPKRRPQPASDFLAPQPLLPGILMAWDFCSTYRALLRLPPFPLARLEMAGLEEAPGDISFPLGSSSGGEAAPDQATTPNLTPVPKQAAAPDQASPVLSDLAANRASAAAAALSVSAGGVQIEATL